jgi:beta-N-acetylhexosaminidase
MDRMDPDRLNPDPVNPDSMNPDRLLMIDLSGTTLTADERAFLAERPVGGVCLFARNIQDRSQLADYTADLRALCGEDLLVALDQEGGGVVRAPFLPYPPGAMALGAANDPQLTHDVAAATARGLRAVGVNVDFAPVADVNNNPANPVIADRSFGGDPEHVARHVVAFLTGLQTEGVAATVKHFPGHGDTSLDSHLALPTVSADRARLDALELLPFREAVAANVAGVMSFHGLLPALDPEHPATLSHPVMTGLLRQRLGFDGVVFTDALSMRAIADTYGPAEAAVRAVAAGVDMPLHTGPLAEHAAILAALEKARDEGRLESGELARSLQRLTQLASRFPAHYAPGEAWRPGDEELLQKAAHRAVVKLGDLEALPPGTTLVLVAAEQVVTSAASQLTATPAETFAEALEAAGFRVRRAFYQMEALEQARRHILPQLGGGAVTVFASTSRVRMTEAERAFAQEVARAAARYVHVALWNPYHVHDLPGPALVTFGFRPPSARAAAEMLRTGVADGQPPVPLSVRTP